MRDFFSLFTRLADWLAYDALGLAAETKLADAAHFFIEDITKIYFMLIVLIYLIALLRSSLNIERARDFLMGKSRYLGYFLAAAFGAITPFCSCSSIPVFIGFVSAGIPVGTTMAFLITSPVINEVAVLIMGSELGASFMVSYVVVGLAVGMLGGWFFDCIKADRFVVAIGAKSKAACDCAGDKAGAAPVRAKRKIPFKERHAFALEELRAILSKIWYWVIIGIGVGALFHGWVPAEWVEANLTAGWWKVPLASVIAIPLYSDATAVIPLAQSMLSKGLPLGTTLTFMLSVVGASLPGFVLLKQVMKKELLIGFFFLLLGLFSLVGWLFNAIEPWII